MNDDDGRWQRILQPPRRYDNKRVAAMLREAARRYFQHDPDHAARLHTRADELDKQQEQP